MAKDIDARIAAEKAKIERAAQKLNALQQKAKSETRKRETRQKIIVGGLVLAYMEKDPSFADRIRDLIAGGVIRPHDREAVGELLNGRSWPDVPPAAAASAAKPATGFVMVEPPSVDFGKLTGTGGASA